MSDFSNQQPTKTGNESEVYIKNGIVIKIPKDKTQKGIKKYIESQKKGFEFATRVAEKLKGIDIILPEKIKLDEETGRIEEKRIYGTEFNVDTYKKLDDETRDKLARDMANFLIAVHSSGKIKSIGIRLGDVLKKSKDPLKRVDYIVDAFQGKLPRWMKQQLEKSLKYLHTCHNVADDVLVTVHGDLRSPNVFYDTDNKRFGIIDFANSGEKSIYEDFVGSPPSLHWDFIKRVINYYNENTKLKVDKKPLLISEETIKNLLVVRLAQAEAMGIIKQGNKPSDAIAALRKNWNLLGLVQNANKVFARATKDIVKKVRVLLSQRKKSKENR